MDDSTQHNIEQGDHRRRDCAGPVACLAVCSLLGVILSAGCGTANDLEKVTVRGKVTWQGKPIERGLIRFVPIAETRGPTSVGEIVASQYHITARGGVPVGEHRVEIEAYASDAPKQELPIEEWPPATNYLPVQHNRESELTVTIPAQHQEHQLDFEL